MHPGQVWNSSMDVAAEIEAETVLWLVCCGEEPLYRGALPVIPAITIPSSFDQGFGLLINLGRCSKTFLKKHVRCEMSFLPFQCQTSPGRTAPINRMHRCGFLSVSSTHAKNKPGHLPTSSLGLCTECGLTDQPALDHPSKLSPFE